MKYKYKVLKDLILKEDDAYGYPINKFYKAGSFWECEYLPIDSAIGLWVQHGFIELITPPKKYFEVNETTATGIHANTNIPVSEINSIMQSHINGELVSKDDTEKLMVDFAIVCRGRDNFYYPIEASKFLTNWLKRNR